jgi:hypothetical protein
LTGAEKRERFRGGTSKYGEEAVLADAGNGIRASKLRSSTKWGLGSTVLREIYSSSKVLQHPAGDQGRLAGVNSRGAARHSTTFEVVVSPAPPLHRSLPRASRRVGGLALKKASGVPNKKPIILTFKFLPRNWMRRPERNTRSPGADVRGKLHVNLSSNVPILFHEDIFDGQIPDEFSGGFTW